MSTPFQPGTTLGPYRIEGPLGAGGMGEVYKARDTRLDRTVAIKILAPGDDQAALRERFEREARTISQLNHPHVCTLYDIGEQPPADPDGMPVRYLVMEFVEGETLAARLERGALPLDQALACAIQIADALDKVHRKGIVHGDLKPGNVMLTKAGVKLLDFGLARQHHPAAPPTGWPDAATRTVPVAIGSVVGTLQYLAPEQLEGKESDARSDIFACGAVIYEMITGRKAFEGESPAAVMAAIMKQQPPPLSSIEPSAPHALDHVVSTCLAKDPDARWQHAGDLTRQLQWIASGDAAVPATAAPDGSRRWWMAAAAAALVALGALAGYARFSRSDTAVPVQSRTSVLLPEGLRFPGAGELGGIERFAISPDGRQIAFVATDPNGNQMLWLRPLDSLGARPLRGTDGALSPFWSPDSRRIGFVARGQLKVLSIEGGVPTVIAAPASSNTSGAWNSDDVIVFTPTPFSAIHRISAAGGTPEAVTTLNRDRAEVLHRNPFFLPDGRHFLYVAVSAPEGETTGARGLYVGSIDGDMAVPVLENGSIAKYAAGRLLFVRDNRLLAQPFDPDRFELSGEPAPVAEQVELIGPSSGAFSVSETGVLAYQRASGPGSQLVWFDPDGRQGGTVGEPGRYGDLELSPDGRQAVVSVLDPATNTRDLWMVDVERGVRTKFTFDRGDEVSPIWDRDGKRVAFASNREGHFDLYVKSASGIGDETLVHADEREKYPNAWLPNQDAILYWSFAGGSGLWSVPVDGEDDPKRALDTPITQGRLSPDGRWLAYTSSESGRSEVYLVPFPNASRRWQVSSAGGTLPRWTSDGRELLFAGRDNRLMSVSLSTENGTVSVGMPRPLFDVRPVTPRSFYAPAPDGRVLVNMQQGDSRSTSITIVQNWSAALTP